MSDMNYDNKLLTHYQKIDWTTINEFNKKYNMFISKGDITCDKNELITKLYDYMITDLIGIVIEYLYIDLNFWFCHYRFRDIVAIPIFYIKVNNIKMLFTYDNTLQLVKIAIKNNDKTTDKYEIQFDPDYIIGKICTYYYINENRIFKQNFSNDKICTKLYDTLWDCVYICNNYINYLIESGKIEDKIKY